MALLLPILRSPFAMSFSSIKCLYNEHYMGVLVRCMCTPFTVLCVHSTLYSMQSHTHTHTHIMCLFRLDYNYLELEYNWRVCGTKSAENGDGHKTPTSSSIIVSLLSLLCSLCPFACSFIRAMGSIRWLFNSYFFFLSQLVCRPFTHTQTHIYKICKFRINYSEAANALTLKQ